MSEPIGADIGDIQVLNMSEPDEPIVFATDGEARLFGRDDDVCDIVIWSALTDPGLSRVAGRLWRVDGELWVRNLSSHHDLAVLTLGQPAGPPLLPRRGAWGNGDARCLPIGTTVILGPGGLELVVTHSEHAAPVVEHEHHHEGSSNAPQTRALPEVPSHLMDIAIALCEPLLLGGPMPATYRQVGQRLGIESHKRVRLLIDHLCERYEEDAFASHLHPWAHRRQDSARGLSAGAPTLVNGVWRFPKDTAEPEPAPGGGDLPVPRYVYVAQLLVRRGLVRERDLGRLPKGGGAGVAVACA